MQETECLSLQGGSGGDYFCRAKGSWCRRAMTHGDTVLSPAGVAETLPKVPPAHVSVKILTNQHGQGLSDTILPAPRVSGEAVLELGASPQRPSALLSPLSPHCVARQ